MRGREREKMRERERIQTTNTWNAKGNITKKPQGIKRKIRKYYGLYVHTFSKLVEG